MRIGLLVVMGLLAAPAVAQDAARGAELFAAHCAACHGPAAEGDGPLLGKILLAASEIARREGVEAQDAEVETEIARIAERAGKSREALRAQLAKEGDLAALASRIREEKTLDLLKSNASIELT